MATTRKQTARGRFYTTPDGDFPSSTNILSCIGKPALITWSAKEERNLVLNCSADLYQDCPPQPKMNRLAWISTMEQRLGKQRAHQRLLSKAGDIGTQAHKLIEWTLRAKLCQEPGPAPAISAKAMWAFSVFEKWAKLVDLRPILIEQTVYSVTHGYAGTMDLFADINLPSFITYLVGRGEQIPPYLQQMANEKEKVLALIDWKTGKAVYPESHLQNGSYRHALREMGHGASDIGIIVRLPKDEKDPEPEAVLADDEEKSLETFLAVKKLWHFLQAKDKWLAAKEKEEANAA